jgi:uncharacterized protein (DUF433 family)
MIAATENFYITTDEAILSGEPIIKDTRTPVRAIVELYRLGISPEEIPTHLPHLSLSQVFAALSYYSDHTEEINEYILKNRVEEKTDLPLNK